MIKVIMAVLNRIKNTSSRNQKEEILKEFADNKEVTEVLKFLYNDLIVTGLSNKKIKKVTGVTTHHKLGNIFEAFDYLRENNTGSDYDIATIKTFIYHVADSEEELEFLEELFTKSFKSGVTAKTLNKVYGKGFVPEFGCMLGVDFSKVKNGIKSKFYVTTKLDGQRLVALVDSFGNTNFFSRNGKNVTGLQDISNAIKTHANERILTQAKFNKGFVLDGEVIVSDPSIPKDRTCSETISIMSSKEEIKTGLKYHIFDIIPIEEFEAGKSTDTYTDRRKSLEHIQIGMDETLLTVVPLLYSGEDTSVIPNLLEEVESHGEEGLMINLDDYYQTKRTNSLIKVKSFESSDLKVIDTFEGEGRLKGVLGGIVVEYKGNPVKVGTGFTDEQRVTLKPKDLIGKIAEIKYFAESTNKDDDTLSLRFPVFVGIRTDKDEADE